MAYHKHVGVATICLSPAWSVNLAFQNVESPPPLGCEHEVEVRPLEDDGFPNRILAIGVLASCQKSIHITVQERSCGIRWIWSELVGGLFSTPFLKAGKTTGGVVLALSHFLIYPHLKVLNSDSEYTRRTLRHRAASWS